MATPKRHLDGVLEVDGVADQLGRASKRAKLDEYLAGAVIKVKVHNFMTYGDAELTPGPRLNLVLGPNGTGKSSFVCALCVGLAGSVSLLGRADNMLDFIRRGEREAWTEITLSSGDPTRPLTIRRHIKKTMADDGTWNCHSDWKINGRDCTQKEVKDKVKELNVQLDNLCQFLPQDKVVSFAQMKPTELLRATQQAIGDSHLKDLHAKLITRKQALRDLQRAKDSTDSELARLQKQNESVQRDVQRLQEREKLQEEAKLLERKIPFVRQHELQEKYKEEKEKLKSARERLAEIQRQVDAQTAPLREAQQRQTARSQEASRLDSQVRQQDGRCGSLEHELDEQGEALQRHQDALDGLDAEVANAQRALARLQQEIANIESDLATHKASAPPSNAAERQAIGSTIRDLYMQVRSAENEVTDINEQLQGLEGSVHQATEKLAKLQSKRGQRLRALEQRSPGITQAAEWVHQQNLNGGFEAHVYGPLAAEIDVKDPQHAIYLEQQVRGDLWGFFVAQKRADQDKLVAQFRGGGGFRVSVHCYTGDPAAPIRHPDGEPSDFQQYGITATLDQVFDAPGVIKRVLCDEVAIHRAYVGTDRTEQMAERVLEECKGVGCLWTPKSCYRARTSLYNPAARSQSVFATWAQSRLLRASDADGDADKQVLQDQLAGYAREEAALKAQKQEKQAEFAAAKRREAEAKAEQKRLDDALKKHRDREQTLNTKLHAKKLQLAKARQEADPQLQQRKRARLQGDVEHASEAVLRKSRDLAAAMKRCFQLLKAVAVAKAAAGEASMQVVALKRVTDADSAALQRYQGLVETLRRGVARSRDELAAHQASLEQMTPELRAQLEPFNEIDSVEKLHEAINERVDKAQGIVCGNPHVIEEYRKRQRRIAALTDEAGKQQEEVDTAAAEIQRMHDEWLPELQRIVANISTTFAANFAQIGCAGEVSLAEHPDDYAQYAIEIKVKFRDEEELTLLTANRQSGGERSVATILYLISIQEVTVCPFRVVDEINQGMDPHNERRVFMQLVDAACRDGTPQCFLLTPKLLPGLPFQRSVTVLQIMNGPHIADVARTYRKGKFFGNRPQLTAVAA